MHGRQPDQVHHQSLCHIDGGHLERQPARYCEVCQVVFSTQMTDSSPDISWRWHPSDMSKHSQPRVVRGLGWPASWVGPGWVGLVVGQKFLFSVGWGVMGLKWLIFEKWKSCM